MADSNTVNAKCKDAYLESCVVAGVQSPWEKIAELTAENAALKTQVIALETKIANAQAALA